MNHVTCVMSLLLLLQSAPQALAQTSRFELGGVLGWKFQHAPGIETRNGRLTRWPAALGPRPTAEQIDAWTQEYRAWREQEDAERACDLPPEETARLLEELIVVLIEERVIPRGKVPVKLLDAMNARRRLRGRPEL